MSKVIFIALPSASSKIESAFFFEIDLVSFFNSELAFPNKTSFFKNLYGFSDALAKSDN